MGRCKHKQQFIRAGEILHKHTNAYIRTHACVLACTPHMHAHMGAYLCTFTNKQTQTSAHTNAHTHTQTSVVLSTKITCTVSNEYIALPLTPCFFLLPLILSHLLPPPTLLSPSFWSILSQFTSLPTQLPSLSLSTPSSTPLLFSHTLTRFLACMTVTVTWLCVRLYFISSFTSASPSVTTSLSRSCSSRTMRWRKV